jgi:hypothetical protein
MRTAINAIFFALVALISGCTSASHSQGSAQITRDAIGNEKGIVLTGSDSPIGKFPVSSKRQWMQYRSYGGRYFMWVFTGPNHIWSTPGCGSVSFDVLAGSEREVTFQVTTNHGLPLNLSTGQIIERADAIGKKYKAEINGGDIVSVAEVR